MATKITVTIPRDPSKGVSIDVDGVTGPRCAKLTEKLEAAMGKVQAREEKGEFHQMSQDQGQEQYQ